MKANQPAVVPVVEESRSLVHADIWLAECAAHERTHCISMRPLAGAANAVLGLLHLLLPCYFCVHVLPLYTQMSFGLVLRRHNANKTEGRRWCPCPGDAFAATTMRSLVRAKELKGRQVGHRRRRWKTNPGAFPLKQQRTVHGEDIMYCQ